MTRPIRAVRGGNLAEGYLALQNLTSGAYNTGNRDILAAESDRRELLHRVWAPARFLAIAQAQIRPLARGRYSATPPAALTRPLERSPCFLTLSGASNTAVGDEALEFNFSAVTNAAVGQFALQNNDSSGNGTANFNTAVGGFALLANVDGTRNTAVGAGAIESGDGGNDNTAVGELAGSNISGNSNTCLGSSAGSNLVDGEGNIYIGAQVQAGGTGEFEFIRIGNDTAFTFPYDTFIAGIFNRDVAVGTAVFVFVDDTGKLGTILVDAAGNKVATPQAMLNESRNQQKRIAELEGTVERLAAMVKEQAAQIQKVSAQLEVNKPAPQVVANKP